jgi:hypothetical protein
VYYAHTCKLEGSTFRFYYIDCDILIDTTSHFGVTYCVQNNSNLKPRESSPAEHHF